MIDDYQAACSAELAMCQKLPLEFLYAVMGGISMANTVQYPRNQLKPLCAYHEHGLDEESITACAQKTQQKRKRVRTELDLKVKRTKWIREPEQGLYEAG